MANLRNINITITASDQTGGGISSALSNISRLGGGLGSVGNIATGVFGGIMGATVFRGIASGIGNVVSSAFGLNNRMAESEAAARSMVNAISESEPVATSSFGAASKAAQAFERTMREVREREADGNADYADNIDKIKSKILDAQNEISDKTSARVEKEKQQLQDLEESYAKTYERLTERIDDEMLNFQERMYDLENQKQDKLDSLADSRSSKEKKTVEGIADANQDYADKIANIEESLSDKLLTLNKQLAEAKNRYDIEYYQAKIADAEADAAREKQLAAEKRDAKISELNTELAAFIAANDAEIAKVTERMNHEIALVQQKHDIKISRLQSEMEQEKAEYEKRKGRIEKDTADDIAGFKKAGEEKVSNLKDQLAKQEEQHRRFLRDIEEAYADASTKMDSAMSGGGGAGRRSVDFQFDFGDAFRNMDGGEIDKYLGDIQKLYTKIGVQSPFNIGDIQTAGKAMVGYTDGTSENMEKIINMTQSLAARNPMQGMQGATQAMVELFGSGNITSLARRFDIPKESLSQLSQAKDATEFIELLNEALERNGINMGLVEAKTQTMGGAWDNLVETFNLAVSEMTKPVWDALTEKLVGINKWLVDNDEAITNWGTAIGGTLSTFITPVIDGIGQLAIILQSFWDAQGQTIMQWFKDMAEQWFPVFTSALQLVKTIWTETVQPALEKTIIPGMQRIFAKLSEFWLTIAPEIKKTLDFVMNWWKENSDSIMTIVKIAWAVIEFVIKTGIDLLSGAIKIGLALIRGDWGAAWEGIKSTFKGIWENMKNFVGDIWEAIGGKVKAGINGVIDQINGFINGLNDKLGKTKIEVGGVSVGGWQIPNIPKLAAGGIVNSPTLAMIGEAGPEAVVPLGKGGGGLGGGVNIYVTGNEILTDESAMSLAEKIGNAFKDQLALQGQYLYS